MHGSHSRHSWPLDKMLPRFTSRGSRRSYSTAKRVYHQMHAAKQRQYNRKLTQQH